MGESVTMNMLHVFGFSCGAVSLFLLARKTEDKFGRTIMFVLAALNLVLLLFGFLLEPAGRVDPRLRSEYER